MAISKFLSIFFQKLNTHNISYCILRNYESLPTSLNGSDLDILIAKKDINNFYNLLNETLEVTNGKIITQYGALTPRICIIGGGNGEWYGIQFDVHEGILPYKTTPMFSADFILKRANQHNSIWVANDNDASFIAFLKQIFNNKTYKKKYLLEAQKAWLKNKDSYLPILKSLYSKEFIQVVNEVLSGESDIHINKKNIELLIKLGHLSLTKEVSVKYKNFISKSKKISRFFSPPGFTITVLGTDGAGKTTIINAIWKPLNEAVHNDIHYEHFRPNLIPSIAELFGAKKSSEPINNPHASRPSGTIGSVIRLFYYTIDYIFGYQFKVYPSLVKSSSIWIFDRYYYDYLIDSKRSRISLPHWVIMGVNLFIPRVDLIICLGTDANKIYKRKPELELDEIKRQLKALKTFQENEKRAVWIDTGSSLDISIDEVLTIIKNKMSQRYKDDK